MLSINLDVQALWKIMLCENSCWT